MPFGGEVAVDLGGGLVEPELDDGQVRGGWLQVVADGETRERELRLVELFEAAAEVDEEEVAFVAEEREDRRVTTVAERLHLSERRGGFVENCARASGESARQADRRKRII